MSNDKKKVLKADLYKALDKLKADYRKRDNIAELSKVLKRAERKVAREAAKGAEAGGSDADAKAKADADAEAGADDESKTHGKGKGKKVPPKLTLENAHLAAEEGGVPTVIGKVKRGSSKKEPYDYLRQWQVRGDTKPGSKSSDPAKGSRAEKMKAFLLKAEKIQMFIPRNLNESAKILQSINLNGYRLDLPKQEYLELPRPLVDVLMDSLHQTKKAYEDFEERFGLDRIKEGANVGDVLA